MILNDIKIEYKEVDIQESIQKLLSNPIRIWKSSDNKRFKILSAGFINPYEGPDLKNVSIYYNGQIITGDAEIDLKSSNWYKHKHNISPNFEKVILHIVFDKDKQIDREILTLILEPNEISIKKEKQTKKVVTAEDLIVIQEFSLFRLERVSKYFDTLYVENKNLNITIFQMSNIFLSKYFNKRRRLNVYTQIDYIKIHDTIREYLSQNDLTEQKDFHLKLNNFLSLKYPGNGLKFEILVNAILPSLYSFHKDRSILLDWYYKVLSRNKYAKLKKRFPHIPQKYVWQQQGMLELLRDSGEEKFMIKDIEVKYSLN